MIDKINFLIPIADATEWKTQKCVNELHTPYADCYIGKVKNLEIRQNLVSVSIVGSLAKFYHGENMSVLQKHGYVDEVKESLEKLESETKINLSNAVVREIEIGTSEILKNPCADYLSLFGVLGGRYKILRIYGTELETVSYQTRTGFFEFYAYDKTKEMTDRRQGGKIPDEYKNKNVLRLELRIKGKQGIRSIFKRELKPYDLTDKEVYAELKNQFYEFYKSIPKMGREVFADKSKATKPQEIEKLCAEQFRQTNTDIYNNLVSQSNLTDRNKKALQVQNKRNQSDSNISERNDLILELDEKIRLRCN